ncbi:hypothetical protein BOTBODRAFT_173246 [Botryobasidium botryosum FD-172 SS1]|uniref:Threonyl/alanyl tRNA synthetase SAD domain-containing protein n=1 Tax=Botryobasidium botryosum (strain FD-172 SS1) TaxID=930990 RepID=A0A067MNT7_BOTB1|nr:hypothetical protein BOTBODRAFT_173246 [Botryobasidium botryosum FD-172 SS1]
MAAVTVLSPDILSAPSALRTPADYVTFPLDYQHPVKRFTTITRVEKRAPESGGGGKKNKKPKPSAAESGSDGTAIEWELEFEDTVLFPEGGGQPCDYGTAKLLNHDSPEIKITNVFRRNLDAIHITSFPSADAGATDLASLGWVPGQKVILQLDWARRRDHMQQHTGQHLLSALFDQFPNDTLGWSLTSSGPCYLDLAKCPSPAQIEQVQRRANEIIAEGRRVRVEVKLESARERPETMPVDYRDGVVRYVHLHELDINPCCGTHHHSLAFLNTIFIFPGTQLMSGPPRHRLTFAVGDRVLSSLSAHHAALKDAGGQIGCAALDVPERVEGLIRGKKDAQRREKVLRAEAARALAADLSKSLSLKESGGGGGGAGVWVGRIHREEESTDVEFLGEVLRCFVPPADSEWLVILSSGPISSSSSSSSATPSSGPGGCLVMAGSSDALVKRAGELLKAKLGGKLKGGGKGRWQGKVSGAWVKGDGGLLDGILDEAGRGQA